MSARLSSSLPETPASDVLRSQLRASYGVVESPLKRHTSGGARPFADDTAKDLSSSGRPLSAAWAAACWDVMSLAMHPGSPECFRHRGVNWHICLCEEQSML